ncbi:MAG: alpha-glucan family phosphorylase, partial [Pseudomonadota bacterium]
IGEEQLFSLGNSPSNEDSFNMTALALRGSRFHNGVSRIHGGVASKMESYVWPQISPEENPISYVTNGVHLSTFLAREWVNLFDMRFSDWRNELLNEQYWQHINDIPDIRFWSVRQELKTVMFRYVCAKASSQHRRNGVNENTIVRMTAHLQPRESDTLVLGFARRFATYKRATLLFSYPQRLARILGNPERPVILIFAGKAHPNDQPGQKLIQQIHDFSMRPEFLGKIILLEGYDLALARKLVAGVDVWLNNPEYPLEASGTSGEKAGVNGVLNLSVLDGWWAEGYNGENGWAITPHGSETDAVQRDKNEAMGLLDILEQEVIPEYFDRDHQGYSPKWVARSKASMKSLIPHYSAQRMVMDYVRNFYGPARDQHKRLMENQARPAIELAQWKKKVRELWPGISMQLTHEVPTEIKYDEVLSLDVLVFLNGLNHDDVVVECLFGNEDEQGRFILSKCYKLDPEQQQEAGDQVTFSIKLQLDSSGLQYYKIRMYPYHPLLSHSFEMGFLIWL